MANAGLASLFQNYGSDEDEDWFYFRLPTGFTLSKFYITVLELGWILSLSVSIFFKIYKKNLGWNPKEIDLGEMVVSGPVYVLGRVRFALIGVKFLNYELTPKCFIKIN